MRRLIIASIIAVLVGWGVLIPAAHGQIFTGIQDRTGGSGIQDRTGGSGVQDRVVRPQPPANNSPPADAPGRGGDGRDSGRDRDGRWHGRHRHGGGYPCPWLPGFAYSPVYWPVYPLYPTRVFGYTFTLPTPVMNDVAPVVVQDPPARPAATPPRRPQATNAEQKARAGRFIGFGDTQFEKQNYLGALGRYKTAMETAPDLAESYLRQAFARVAMGQYENAADAFRRGLAVRSDWRGAPLRLDDLYAGAAAKGAHIETLAKAVEDNPFDADLMLVLGLQLYFDGQSDKAQLFLTRAAQLGGNGDRLLDKFLPQPKPAGAKDAAPVGGKVVF